jgi:hypothetical protein
VARLHAVASYRQGKFAMKYFRTEGGREIMGRRV